MPLLDHFHPPLSAHRRWQAFHSAWASGIARELNEDLLPPRYFAEPNVQVGGLVEIDLATFEETPATARGEDLERCPEGRPRGSLATAVWSPPKPTISLPVEFADLDLFEVRVMSDEEGPRLVAAIELVSPANKDRPTHRRAFATKCASYLQSGIGLVVVDIVTSRPGSPHAELLSVLQIRSGVAGDGGTDLSATAYRAISRAGESMLEGWAEALRVGSELPTLPLWIGAELSLPLALERSYAATCASLRIAA